MDEEEITLFGPPSSSTSEKVSGDDEAYNNLFGSPPEARVPRDDDATHLIVLQHGLHGTSEDFTSFSHIMQELFASKGINAL
jgi:hypothetical protein